MVDMERQPPEHREACATYEGESPDIERMLILQCWDWRPVIAPRDHVAHVCRWVFAGIPNGPSEYSTGSHRSDSAALNPLKGVS